LDEIFIFGSFAQDENIQDTHANKKLMYTKKRLYFILIILYQYLYEKSHFMFHSFENKKTCRFFSPAG